jgi:hypothetical protein
LRITSTKRVGANTVRSTLLGSGMDDNQRVEFSLPVTLGARVSKLATQEFRLPNGLWGTHERYRFRARRPNAPNDHGTGLVGSLLSRALSYVIPAVQYVLYFVGS